MKSRSKDKIEKLISEMPKGDGGEFVPEINAAYSFTPTAYDVVLDIKENSKVLLTGHCGTGKTSLVCQIAARSNQGVLRANLNSQMTIGDFVGLWSVKGSETVWIDGILPKAMKEGLWLILDEIDFAEPMILSVLNSVLEYNGKLLLKEKGHEVITPHKNFRVFATANTVGIMSAYRHLYQGTNILNEAFLDRWRCYYVDYLPVQEEVNVLCKSVDGITPGIAKILVSLANEFRTSFTKEELSSTFSLRRLLDWACLTMRYKNPYEGAAAAFFAKVSATERETMNGLIKRKIGAAPEEDKE